MSAKFCLLIPAKILRSEKHFSEKLRLWLAEHEGEGGSKSGLFFIQLIRISATSLLNHLL
jgi:hypothetical protein